MAAWTSSRLRIDALAGRALSADRRGRLGLPPPAVLQLVQGGVELAPLAAGEEGPFQRVLQPGVVLARAAAGVLGAGAADVQPIEDRMMPGAVVGPLADDLVQPPPVVGRDRLVPIVQVAQNDPHHPGAARVADPRQVGQGLLDPRVGLGLLGPAGILRQPRAAGTAGRVQVADDHVVQEDVVQAAGPQPPAHQVRVHVEHRQFGQGLFQILDEGLVTGAR